MPFASQSSVSVEPFRLVDPVHTGGQGSTTLVLATGELTGGKPKLGRSGRFRVEGAGPLSIGWADALGKELGSVSIGGPSTALNFAPGGGSDVPGLLGVGGKPSSPNWAAWPDYAEDAAFLDRPPIAPGSHAELVQAVKIGLAGNLDEWRAYFLELAAFEEAVNGLMYRAHVAGRWDLLDELYPRVWQLLARRNRGTPQTPRYRFDEPAPPWPGFPPNFAQARLGSLSWKTDAAAVDHALYVVKKRAALGLGTPAWSGFVVPYVPFWWVWGDVKKKPVLSDLATPEAIFAVFIPEPDGLFEIVAKVLIAGGLAAAFAAGGGAILGGILGDGIGAELAVGALESELQSLGSSAILTGGAELDLDAALSGLAGTGLDLIGGGELADLIGDGALADFAQQTAGGVASGKDLGDAALAALVESDGGGLPVFADIFEGFDDILDGASTALQETAAFAGNLAEIKTALDSFGDDKPVAGQLVSAPAPVLASTLDPMTGQAPFAPLGPLSGNAGLLLVGVLLIGGVYLTTRAS